ncbi:hypothetical protein [Mycolicibacterium sp.]|uniref:hypothetical protein n=1 Tax=Mycolicibacterium sp. TaxID=2320850 RepID=UPI0028AC864E|nr:hypothetical protein [Mycolicibacterium sp.]
MKGSFSEELNRGRLPRLWNKDYRHRHRQEKVNRYNRIRTGRCNARAVGQIGDGDVISDGRLPGGPRPGWIHQLAAPPHY